MCRVPVQLRELVKQRLAEAAEEIFALVEKTICDYEEHLIAKYEQQRQQGALCISDGVFPGERPCDPPHMKEEQDRAGTLKTEDTLSDPTWTPNHSPAQTQPGESDVAEFESCDVTVKTEEGGAWTAPLHDLQTETLPPPHIQTVTATPTHTQTETSPPPHSQSTTDELLPQDTWTEEQLDLSRTLNCAFSVSPPGAVLRFDSVGKVHQRRFERRAQKRPHECPLCGLRFQSHFNLETHLRVHTGERPFSCSVCEKTFNRKDSMANHMKIHLGETFCCSECGKRYSDKSNLRRHAISVHAGKGHLGRTAPESHD